MQNSMMIFTFIVFDWKYLFGQIKIDPKYQNCQFQMKFGEYAEFNDDVTFSVFEHKYLSWVNLVQKFKIVCSK